MEPNTDHTADRSELGGTARIYLGDRGRLRRYSRSEVRPGSRCKILVVMDGLETIKPGMDSTLAIVGEAHSRGHAVDICTGDQLALRDGLAVAPARPVTGMAANELPVVGDVTARQPIDGYDAVLTPQEPAWSTARTSTRR